MTVTTSWNWAGARWWKFDFHAHTPASTDFGKGLLADDPQKKPEPKDWLLAFMRAEVDCVAVTDHDTAGWIDILQNALKEMEREPPGEFRPLTLFPGVEITTSSSAHILAIFPPGTSKETLDHFLGKLELEGTGETKRSKMNAVKIVEQILEANALAIPAHLDDNLDEDDERKSASLVKRHSGFEVVSILQNPRVLAIELKETSWTGKNYTTELKNRCIVHGSDAHHLSGDEEEDETFPGRRYTWIKMEKPTFDGLKLALIDSHGSVKSYSYSDPGPNVITHPIIERVEVRNAKYLGTDKNHPFHCILNPWMNAIIGGRGTGKSTFLEFIRLGLDRVAASDSLKQEFKKYYLPDEDGCLVTTDTTIMVYFRRDQTRFRLTWHGDAPRLIEKMVGEEWEVSPGVVSERFPIQIRSQKEIFEMAGNPKQLMNLVDESPDVRYDEWARRRTELEDAFLASSKDLRQAKEKVERKDSILGQLSDVKRQIDLYQQSQKNSVILQYNACLSEERRIGQWSESLLGIKEEMSKIPETPVPTLNRDAFFPDIGEHTMLLETAGALEEEIAEGVRMITEGKMRIMDAIDRWKSTQSSLPEMGRIAAAKSAFEEYKMSLGEDSGIIGASDLYNGLLEKKEELLKNLGNIESAEKSLSALRQATEECYIAVKEHRKKLTHTRREFLKSKLNGVGYISVSVIPYGDREAVVDGFRKVIKIDGDTFFSSIGTTDFSEDNGSLLGHLYNDKRKIQMDELERLKRRVADLWDGRIDGEISNEIRFREGLKRRLSVEDVDRLWCWFPDDYLLIRYKSSDEGTGSRFLSLTTGSPGQKSAALLTFILSFGTDPLILDQPEDDLDNRLICQMVVRRLREIKKRRQVIVVTHNANVVINGCAELVVPLEAKDGETRCVCSGCLHEAGVRDAACSILEGGKEAFEKRYRRVIG